MSILSRIAAALGVRPKDYSGTFPPTIESRTCGRFNLRRSALTVGDQVVDVFCKYERLAGGSPPDVVFSPTYRQPACADRWVRTIDEVVPRIMKSWRDLLRADAKVVPKKASGYLRDGITCQEMIERLSLATIVVSQDGSTGLRFDSLAAIGHCNLSVEISPEGGVQAASIGG